MFKFRKLVATLIAAAHLVTVPMGAYADTDKYWFRAKGNLIASSPVDNPDDTENPGEEEPAGVKKLTIGYVGAVGYFFTQKLPAAGAWKIRSWELTEGVLPAGLSLDPATGVISGTPSAVALASLVKITGLTATGAPSAVANVTFNVETAVGQVFQPFFYAHTGKFKSFVVSTSNALSVASYSTPDGLPAGMTVKNLNLEGAPAAAGTYSFRLLGRNTRGETVSTYIVTLLVQDGPTFDEFADTLWELPNSGNFPYRDYPAAKLQHAVEEPGLVKYYLEFAPGKTFPMGVRLYYVPAARLDGTIPIPYEQTTVRWKAVDVDGTEGWSNWYTFGTTDPQPVCQMGGVTRLSWLTGKAVNSKIRLDRGDSAETRGYKLVAGTIPAGVSLDEATGYLKGTPAVATAEDATFTIEVSLTTDGNTVSDTCDFEVTVANSKPDVIDRTDEQSKHLRRGAFYAGTAEVKGGIPNYSIKLAQAPGTVAITNNQQNAITLSLAGRVTEPGDFNLVYELANGDGKVWSALGGGYLSVYDFVTINPVADFSVQRLAGGKLVKTVDEYVPETIIPDVLTPNAYPKMTLLGPALPEGLEFDGKYPLGFGGNVTAPAGRYGPYEIVVQDKTLESDKSNPFHIDVLPREPLTLTTSTAELVATVATNAAFTPVTAKVPAGLMNPDLQFTIAPQLPSFATFDETAGGIEVEASFGDIGDYGPYVISVTDSEGMTASSEPFSFEVEDRLAPTISGTKMIRGNVSFPITGENLEALLVDGTFEGQRAEVEFDFDGDAPGGLQIDPDTGFLSGAPTEPFEGFVKIAITDSAGRVGKAEVAYTVLPFPTIETKDHQLPRKAAADQNGMTVVSVDGFWGLPTNWALAPTSGPLPAGLQVGSGGKIVGMTFVDPGVYPGIVLSAADPVTGVVAQSAPFSIEVTPVGPLSLSYPNALEMTLDDDAGRLSVLSNTATAGANLPVMPGSFAAPLTYAITSVTPASAAFSITDKGAIVDKTGMVPDPGDYSFTVEVQDASGETATASAAMSVKVSGTLKTTSTISPKKLRVGESFLTETLAVTNNIGTVTFSAAPALRPLGITFDAFTGVFGGAVEETLSSATNYAFEVTASDTNGRVLETPLTFSLNAVPPLSFEAARPATTSEQYPANPVGIALPKLDNPMGKVTYSLSGTVPGTKVDVVLADGVFDHYRFGSTTTTDAADLPPDAIMIDPLTGILQASPSQVGTYTLTVTATDDHADTYAFASDPTRLSNNSAKTDAQLVVTPAEPLTLSFKDATLAVVHNEAATKVITAKDAAYGKATMQLVGTLPAGLDWTTVNDTLTISGTPEVPGVYPGFTVSAVDAAGRSVSQSFKIVVKKNDDPIELVVDGDNRITTKAGYPFKTGAADYGNEIGQVVFGSIDVEIGTHPGMTVDTATGELTGSFAAPGTYTVDLFVSDDSDRVTSVPVTIVVFPAMEIAMASQTTVMQGKAIALSPSITNIIGTRSFLKGKGTWPAGVNVGLASGDLTGVVTAAPGTYSGLTITGDDAFMSGTIPNIVDHQESNAFSIVVVPSDSAPAIDPIPPQKFNVGSAVSIKPLVKDLATGEPWNAGGLVFEVNALLPAGLTLNGQTGEISGTPTEAFVNKSIQLKVTTAATKVATTTMSLIVEPVQPMAVADGFSLTQTVHVGIAKTIPLSVKNAAGKVTYTVQATSSPVDSASIAAGTASLVLKHNSAATGRQVDIGAVDEAGRSATIRITVNSTALSANFAGFDVDAGSAYSGPNVTATNNFGTVTYSYANLPVGFTYDASTGKLSASNTGSAGHYTVTGTATDSADGMTFSEDFIIQVVEVKHEYWRLTFNITANVAHQYTSEFTFFDSAGNNLTIGKQSTGQLISTVTTSPGYINYPARFTDGGRGGQNIVKLCKTSACSTTMRNSVFALTMRYVNPISPSYIELFDQNGGTDAQIYLLSYSAGSITLEYSDDGTNWTLAPTTLTKGVPYRATSGSAFYVTNTLTLN